MHDVYEFSELGDYFLVTGLWAKKLYGQMCHNAVKEYALTQCEVDILVFLANNAPYDTARDISRYWAISKSLICKSVDLLVKKGYLASLRDEKDRRRIHLKILPAASDIVARLRQARTDFLSAVCRRIPEEEVEIFMRALKTVTENIEQELI